MSRPGDHVHIAAMSQETGTTSVEDRASSLMGIGSWAASGVINCVNNNSEGDDDLFGVQSQPVDQENQDVVSSRVAVPSEKKQAPFDPRCVRSCIPLLPRYQ